MSDAKLKFKKRMRQSVKPFKDFNDFEKFGIGENLYIKVPQQNYGNCCNAYCINLSKYVYLLPSQEIVLSSKPLVIKYSELKVGDFYMMEGDFKGRTDVMYVNNVSNIGITRTIINKRYSIGQTDTYDFESVQGLKVCLLDFEPVFD